MASAVAHALDPHADPHEGPALPHGTLTPGKFCMWLFLASDAMGFTAFVAAYVVLRAGSPRWIPEGLPPPPVGLTGFNTFLLIVSSVTMVLAYSAVCRGDQGGLRKWLAATMGGGAAFLAIQAYEWTHLIEAGLTPRSSLYGATFYACTGYHGLHVLAGVVYLGCTLAKAMRGGITERNSSEIEILGLYWHFVDLVWILLFTVIYLI